MIGFRWFSKDFDEIICFPLGKHKFSLFSSPGDLLPEEEKLQKKKTGSQKAAKTLTSVFIFHCFFSGFLRVDLGVNFFEWFLGGQFIAVIFGASFFWFIFCVLFRALIFCVFFGGSICWCVYFL